MNFRLKSLEESKIKESDLFNVFMLKDDFTPMEFVVEVLQTYFFLDRRKAIDVMQEVYDKGKATCGVYTKDVAETKVALVTEYATQNEHPLNCNMETVAV
jgi:ATP-dependent Clp protease adaptor protein ClpS